MNRPALACLLAILIVPTLSSCIALLDFDELSAGSGGAAGSGAGGGDAGGPEGGAGGAPECGDCDDDDPCTVDSCEVVDGTPTCRNDYTVGLALDGVDEAYPAEKHHRVTMVGGPDAFFFSVFSEEGGERDLQLFRLDADGAESELIASLASVGLLDAGRAVSAAGLAIDDSIGLRLHAFVGVEAVGGGARPWHVVFQGSNWDAAVQIPEGDSYYAADPRQHPVAANIGGDIYGAWLTEAQTVELSGFGDAVHTFSADTQATTLGLFATRENEPAVVYAGTGSGVFLENITGADATTVTPISECEPAEGQYLSLQTVPLGLAGFHFASWTKANADLLVNESHVITCGADGCFADMTCEAPGALTRNSAAVTAKIPGESPSVVHYVVAAPFLAPGDAADSVEAGLSLQFARIDFGDDPLMDQAMFEELGTAFEVSRMATEAPLFPGPDWPAVSYVAPNKVALAWIEPSDAGDELRIQRYQMCLGE